MWSSIFQAVWVAIWSTFIYTSMGFSERTPKDRNTPRELLIQVLLCYFTRLVTSIHVLANQHVSAHRNTDTKMKVQEVGKYEIARPQSTFITHAQAPPLAPVTTSTLSFSGPFLQSVQYPLSRISSMHQIAADCLANCHFSPTTFIGS